MYHNSLHKDQFTMGTARSQEQDKTEVGNLNNQLIKSEKYARNVSNTIISRQQDKQQSIITFLLGGMTQEQFQEVTQVVLKHIHNRQQIINRRLNVNVSLEYLILLILYIYRYRYSRKKASMLVVNVMNSYAGQANISMVADMLYGKSLLGSMLRNNSVTQRHTYVANARKMCLIKEQNIYYQLLWKIFQQQYSTLIDNNIMKQQRHVTTKITKFIKQYLGFLQYKEGKQLLIKRSFNKDLIDAFYTSCQSKTNLDIKSQAIVKIYNKYVQSHKNRNIKYNCYQFIQYLLTISVQQFQQEFDVYNDIDVDILVKFVDKDYVNSLRELRIKASIAKYVEQNSIYIKFSNQFTLDDIQDDIILAMLDNIENRVQRIDGSQDFIIISRVSDNQVFKSLIIHDNKKQIQNILKQCSNGMLYNIVISSKYQYENLGNVRIRYLNYQHKYMGKIKITLHHPKDLVVALLHWTNIKNINQCVNLRNLYSSENIYTMHNIQPLRHLKKIYCYYDEYLSDGSCFLEDLIKNNKLEYIDIVGSDSAVPPILLSKNIENIKFINVSGARIGVEYFGNSVNKLFEIFEKKYVNKNNDYQDIDLNNRQWVQQQFGRENYIKWQQLILGRNVFDILNYKCRLLTILFSQDKQQQRQQMMIELANDVVQYRKIKEQGHRNIRQAIDIDNLKGLINYMIYCKQYNNDDKTRFIKHLYDVYCDDVYNNYNILTLIQYLATIDNQMFISEFSANNDELKQMAYCIIKEEITSISQLKYTSLICKHLECKNINLDFNYSFQLKDVPDNILVPLFQNIDNRIQVILGSESFIIVHRVSDNMIFKSILTDENEQQIEDMLQQYNDGQLYDVILKLYSKYDNLGSIRMRYLNYYNESGDIEIISHPEDLISASLRDVKIMNMNQCINLKNLYSYYNAYMQEDISHLSSLKRMQSLYDEYQHNDTCLLHILFQNNKLEYVSIRSIGENIINSFTLSTNIEKLRFMNIDEQCDIYNIKLDVSDNFPEKLVVYNVATKNNERPLYGILLDFG